MTDRGSHLDIRLPSISVSFGDKKKSPLRKHKPIISVGRQEIFDDKGNRPVYFTQPTFSSFFFSITRSCQGTGGGRGRGRNFLCQSPLTLQLSNFTNAIINDDFICVAHDGESFEFTVKCANSSYDDFHEFQTISIGADCEKSLTR